MSEREGGRSKGRGETGGGGGWCGKMKAEIGHFGAFEDL